MIQLGRVSIFITEEKIKNKSGMEFKHCSHNHGLAFHQMPRGSEIQCSGCKSAGSGNVYVCWQCNYFLHEQCFRATRSLRHPSHTLHPLTLTPYPTYPSASFFCNSCNLVGNGFSYSCSECEFDIHIHCALTPNVNPHATVPNFPIPNDAQNYTPQTQNPIYPPIRNNSFPTYPPQNHEQNYSHQPQSSTYPPIQNNPFPNFPPDNTTLPNEAPNYGIHSHPPHLMPQNNPIPAFPLPNPPPSIYSPPVSIPYTNPPPSPPQPTQPNTTISTYSTLETSTTTTNPPPPSVQFPQTNNPQSKPPPSIIKHFSHPHVLKAMEVQQKDGKTCSACECALFGSSYCCTEPHCTFNLHKPCFDSPLEARHKSHLEHPLKLLTTPTYNDGFTCNACLKDGKAFVYNCSTCSYDLHIDCISWPETVSRDDHKHDLTLYYSSPAAETSQEVAFVCDACKNPVHEMAWMYYCRECDFGTHLECMNTWIKQENVSSSGEKSEEELIRETELKFAVFQLLLDEEGRKAALELWD